ncbi:MAG: (Fe-S)-binding protein [Elusimicrobia bacterium]|nr:(Fe-S)-binding protein [Elusimicrobiota bacterium]
MAETAGKLQTDLGERSTYDAASQCSRCGYCEQSCPTYVATAREPLSPRGRNQIVRLMLEGRVPDKESVKEALSTCLLCGACSTACYARVPTADIVLEGRRMLESEAPLIARILGRLAIRRPRLLAVLLKIGYAFKRAGISRLGRPFLRAAGLGALAEADASMDEAPREFLSDALGRRPAPENPAWFYFAACGPNYVLPRVGLATWAVLENRLGPGRFLNNACCGLLSYNYGTMADARDAAIRAIGRWEALGNKDAPVVADCSSCADFLKRYPRLFLDDAAWKARAEAFSARVRDVIELVGTEAAPARDEAPLVYHESCRARHGQGLAAPQELLRRACGESYKALPESDVCCGGAGAFSFLHPELSDEVLRRKISNVARSGAQVVLASSTSCLLQLARGLRKYYPQARAFHLTEFLAQSPAQNDGTKTRT